MKIILIRHSKTDRNPDIPITCWGLSDKGIDLAKKLSKQEIIKKLDVVYTSFQTKALETAVIIAKAYAIPVKPDDRLTEVTSFTGSFEKDYEKYSQNVYDFYQGNIERINNGETKIEALHRFNNALEDISQRELQNEYVGIISHGNILTLFTAQYRDLDCYKLHTQIKQPDIAIFDWKKKEFQSFFGEV